MKDVFILSFVFCLVSSSVFADEAHEAHTEFLEPLALHHAHIENELRINSVFRENSREETEDSGAEDPEYHYRDIFESELEIGWASKDKRIGVEAHIPFTNEGREESGENIFGLGDVEIEPIRYSFIRSDDLIWTASVGFVLPSGKESNGLGEGRAFIEPHLLVDQRLERWSFTANAIPSFELSGSDEISFTWGFMAARELSDLGWNAGAISIEWIGESVFPEDQEDTETYTAVAGWHVHVTEDWRVRLGIGIPLSDDRNEARTYFVQIGTHWEGMKT